MKRNRSYQKKRWSIVRQFLHHVRSRVSHLANDNYCVNTAPCRMLAWGKSLLNVKSCVSPTGPHWTIARTEGLFTWIIVTRLEQRLEGQKCLSDYQMSQMCHTSACRFQTKPVWELRKPWGLDPRYVQMLKEGYTLPFQSRPA